MLGVPHVDRISVRRAAVRREILDAAWAVAREKGLGHLTLRDVADRVGMRPPSLYSHFASKNEIHDAMFGDAWTEFLRVAEALEESLPVGPRARLRLMMTAFFDFAVADLPRYQLMNQSVLPGFTPSADAYAPSQALMALFTRQMAEVGVTDPGHLDLATSLVGGLVSQQLANDPGGNRFRRLLDQALTMYADHVGLPEE